MAEAVPLTQLLADAALVRKLCIKMCEFDGVDPDEIVAEIGSQKFRAYETYAADVNAVLRALKAMSS
jgi:hypothetical protein